MKATIAIVALAAGLLPVHSWAGDATSARREVLEALESQARLPDARPTLPDQASDRAREVHSTIAFGQKGAAERAAHQAARAAENAAEKGSAADAARNAAEAAADRAGQKSQAAAGEQRADEVRRGVPPAKPNRGRPH
jgi:hypothetical protein